MFTIVIGTLIANVLSDFIMIYVVYIMNKHKNLKMMAQRKTPAVAAAGVLIMLTIVISMLYYHELRQM
ncbi:hypothetical protein [Staphylococcus epidermidis]|uniref:hypothetical protein n=1 Tax=Staphylococcus epidermidis TaxID=1282 RepID=UPI000B7A986F|nr:hypothetical protein [Staphylococcus epidermidis]OXE92883.1 hypothetical protein ATC33_01875 [Staphylococcus epidermidis]